MVMNKRIGKLLKQAEERYPRHLAVAVPEVQLRQDALEKFAELIVRQTMDYASRNWEHGHLLAEDLKVYFGVE
jgi:hypothetical protein